MIKALVFLVYAFVAVATGGATPIDVFAVSAEHATITDATFSQDSSAILIENVGQRIDRPAFPDEGLGPFSGQSLSARRQYSWLAGVKWLNRMQFKGLRSDPIKRIGDIGVRQPNTFPEAERLRGVRSSILQFEVHAQIVRVALPRLGSYADKQYGLQSVSELVSGGLGLIASGAPSQPSENNGGNQASEPERAYRELPLGGVRHPYLGPGVSVIAGLFAVLVGAVIGWQIFEWGRINRRK